MGTRGSALRRAITVACVATTLSLLSGCNQCTKLDERICADLGADCSVWRSDAMLHGMIIPANERRRRVRESTCSAMADDGIYSTRTLPMVRNYIVHLRDPRAPQAVIPMGAPPAGSGGYAYYLLAPIAILGVLGYSAYHKKFVMPGLVANQQAQGNSAADAQARAMAEWQAQQAAQQQPPQGGPGTNGPSGGQGG